MANNRALCEQFSSIIGGQPSFAGGKCVSTISRNQIKAFILGKKFRVTSSFSFESINRKTGRGLCLGRAAFLQKEVNRFISAIKKQGIKVTSVRNEWLFDQPRLIYINIEAVDQPLAFARKVRRALDEIKTSRSSK
ncbi:DUF1259 domain-containing protein [Brevibacillus choshinensis]|uniref:DUF1259 domain-containing protein n=1 Tax=Brevibacillus choshinensis TaxID=54911 RepID=A0ABX7FSB6_BRECH|nr:DUF1259 domain-containing protein [Brevibacillus choshinensis]QRG69138.1 DUF1259 domain-containing protein [Brevibacillus choshinensis]